VLNLEKLNPFLKNKSKAERQATLDFCGQVLVAHVEHGPDGLAVAALETHGVITKDPTARARKASKKH